MQTKLCIHTGCPKQCCIICTSCNWGSRKLFENKGIEIDLYLKSWDRGKLRTYRCSSFSKEKGWFNNNIHDFMTRLYSLKKDIVLNETETLACPLFFWLHLTLIHSQTIFIFSLNRLAPVPNFTHT